MGTDADRVAATLRDRLAEARPDLDWATEVAVGGTPVDVVGRGEDLAVLVELEWRRADPSDNAAKLFRHLDAAEAGGGDDPGGAGPADGRGGVLEVEHAVVVQLFTRYYDLASGGLSAKRRNAAFVGERAAETHERLTYISLTLDLDPPKRGDVLPDGWRAAVEEAVDDISALV